MIINEHLIHNLVEIIRTFLYNNRVLFLSGLISGVIMLVLRDALISEKYGSMLTVLIIITIAPIYWALILCSEQQSVLQALSCPSFMCVCVCVSCSVVSNSLRPPWTSMPGSSVHGILQVRVNAVLTPFNLYAEYIMRNTGLEEVQAGIKIAGRSINNLRYADDTTLMAERN